MVGTVSANSGSGNTTTLTGASTAFTRLNVGDKLEFAGKSNTVYITAIGSDSTLTVNEVLPPGLSGNVFFKAYKVGDNIDLTGKGSAAGTAYPVELGGSTSARSMTLDSSGNVGIGVTPITSHILSCAGPVGISGTSGGTRTSYITNSISASIYYTDGGGSGYFTDFGNLIIQPRTSAARSVVIATGSTTPVERAVVKSTGQVRFVPLAADPAGAEAGDVYYNSVSNRLKYFNGTAWTLI